MSHREEVLSASPRQLQRLLDAVLAVSADLSLSTVLRQVVETATELVGARYGALGVLDATRQSLAEFLTVGVDEEAHATIGALPHGEGILGLLIVDPKPLRLTDLTAHPASHGFPPNHPPMRSFLGVPILVRDLVFGNLYLCDKQGGGPFTETDEELALALAAAAGVAIENARLHERVSELRVIEDRERIARDLHDTVIQRLFATGLALQAVAGQVTDDALGQRLEAAVDDLDTTVREIRTTIFDLQRSRVPGRSLRADLLDIINEAAASLGFRPTVRFEGTVDTSVRDELATNATATLREALANVTRHSDASSVGVVVDVDEHHFRLEVRDNGIGMPPTIREGGQGLRNMRDRAEELGGTLTIEPVNPAGEPVNPAGEANAGTGTVLRWTTPL